MTRKPRITSPMKPQWFHILLALSGRELHGYGIQRQVLDQTDGQLTLWPAMLYRSLTTLESALLVEKIKQPTHEPEDERRQYYRLTHSGIERLAEEAELLARWAQQAQTRQA